MRPTQPAGACQYGATVSFGQKGYEVLAFSSPHNARLRVLDYAVTDYAGMKSALASYAAHHHLGKIFIKARKADETDLKKVGFSREATIRGYFNGIDAKVMSLFTNEQRAVNSCPPLVDMPPANMDGPPHLDAGLQIRPATIDDITAMTALFTETFTTYPFPVYDANFLKSSMSQGNIYQLVMDGDTIAAMAGAEISFPQRCAELTDFATRGQYRGQGLATVLRYSLEQNLDRLYIPNQYTLARAASPGMNRVFARGGYEYTGTLVRNCNIAGELEDMTCWCRPQTSQRPIVKSADH